MKQRFEMIGMYVVEVEGISKRRVNKSEIGCERFLKNWVLREVWKHKHKKSTKSKMSFDMM